MALFENLRTRLFKRDIMGAYDQSLVLEEELLNAVHYWGLDDQGIFEAKKGEEKIWRCGWNKVLEIKPDMTTDQGEKYYYARVFNSYVSKQS